MPYGPGGESPVSAFYAVEEEGPGCALETEGVVQVYYAEEVVCVDYYRWCCGLDGGEVGGKDVGCFCVDLVVRGEEGDAWDCCRYQGKVVRAGF